MREDDSFGIVGLRGSNAATPIHVVDRAGFDAAVAALPAAERQWLHSQGFGGAPDSLALVPDESGRLKAVWVGVRDRAGVYALSALPQALPEGRYRLASDTVATETAVLSWALGSYAFARYRSPRRAVAQLACASEPATKRALTMARAIAQVRDLVNTPAEDLGPEELAQAARALARTHGGRFSQVVGDDLLKRGFPAIHAVGRASTRKPRLIELNWGRPRDPKLVLVGKGVCFDSGGLDIKGADGMRLMKKDMGGAANALGLAQLMGVPFVFNAGINLLAFVFSAAIGIVFGYMPARRAASLDPIVALRFE